MGDASALQQLTTGPGWVAFTDMQQYLHAASVLLLATASGLLLAHHPAHRARSVSDLEQQKTLVIYSSVGALIAIICTVAPSMAFVIFGIGGLMRFRTETGESKNTGHIIMGTLVGLCWGLGMQLVAVLATVYFWFMIYALETRAARSLTVVGIELSVVPRAAEAYRSALERAGCKVLGLEKSLKKSKLEIVVRVPKNFSSDDAAKIIDSVPADVRGTPDWQD
jgi:hypothetical protein